MTVEELQVLSEPSVEGADDFDSPGYEKGMRLGVLPDDIDEDTDSGWQPSSKGLMVKDAVKHSGSRTSSQDQSQGPPKPKKAKRKSNSGKEKLANPEKGKKKRRCETSRSIEGNVSAAVDCSEADVDEANVSLRENVATRAKQEQTVEQEQVGEEHVEHINLTDEADNPPIVPSSPSPV